jgi:uncharacterized protein
VPASLFDTNVWLASVFTSHPFHRPAQQRLKQATPAEPAVFCRATQQSFLRLISTPALLKVYGATGLTNRDAVVTLGALLALPQVCEREEPPRTPALWYRLASRDTASPKLWMDAYLAAFAIGARLRMVTLDQDFKQFVVQGLDLVLLDQAG